MSFNLEVSVVVLVYNLSMRVMETGRSREPGRESKAVMGFIIPVSET